MLSALVVASCAVGSVSLNATKGGYWDEAGLVASLDRKGFTSSKCISEVLANSCDAQSPKVLFKINSNYIKMIDIGIGMDIEELRDMFAMFKSNNRQRQSMGVSGLGGKEALYILSKKNKGDPSTVFVFTRTKNGQYLRAIVPWNDICKSNVYTDKIVFDDMSEDEIVEFNKDRENEVFQNGTTIRWEYSDNLMETLDYQFDKNKREKILEPKDRWDLIFGLANIAIQLEKSDGTLQITLPKYNYFGGSEVDYYTGKNEELIEHYIDDNGKDRFIWMDAESDETKEIKQTSKTVAKHLTLVNIHQSWKHTGTFVVYNGMRKNPLIFDETSLNPRKLDTASTFFSDYESNYFEHKHAKDSIKDYLSKVRLFRNGQCVTEFKLDGFNALTARGGGPAMLKTFHHRTEVHYHTLSTQDNEMDIAMGIQENKNQNQNEFPKVFERLIIYLKERNLKKINSHFDQVINNSIQKKREALALEKQQQMQAQQESQQNKILPASDSESDSESESKVGSEDDENDTKYGSDVDCSDSDSVSTVNNELTQDKEENTVTESEVHAIAENTIQQEPSLDVKDQVQVQHQIQNDDEPQIQQHVTKETLIKFITETFNDESDFKKIEEIYNLAKSLRD